MLGGLLLTASVALLVWVMVGHRTWLVRAGRALFEGLATSASWYTGAQPAPPTPDPEPDDRIPDTLASRTEADLVARLLDRTLARDDYQRAMAELAADDELRHPVSVPPWQ